MITQRAVKRDHAVQYHPLTLPFAQLLTDAQALLKTLQGGRIVALLNMNIADSIQCPHYLFLVAQLLAAAQALLKTLHGDDTVQLRLKNIASAQDVLIQGKRIVIIFHTYTCNTFC